MEPVSDEMVDAQSSAPAERSDGAVLPHPRRKQTRRPCRARRSVWPRGRPPRPWRMLQSGARPRSPPWRAQRAPLRALWSKQAPATPGTDSCAYIGRLESLCKDSVLGDHSDIARALRTWWWAGVELKKGEVGKSAASPPQDSNLEPRASSLGPLPTWLLCCARLRQVVRLELIRPPTRAGEPPAAPNLPQIPHHATPAPS